MHLGVLTYEELVRERARDLELEYIFKHALTQEVAYGGLLTDRRRAIHARIVEEIEDVPLPGGTSISLGALAEMVRVVRPGGVALTNGNKTIPYAATGDDGA